MQTLAPYPHAPGLAEEYDCILDQKASERRLAPQTAMALEDALQRAGWPTGATFGPETSLAESFGVGVRVVRQACRVLEARGVCRLKRGRAGGLIVTEPQLDETALALALHMRWSGTSTEDIWAARSFIEPLVAREAAESARLHALTGSAERGLRARKSPALALAAACLDNFARASSRSVKDEDDGLEDTLLRGSVDLAHRRASELVDIRRKRDSTKAQRAHHALVRPAHASTLSASAARRIASSITYEGCANNDRIGSLTELATRYDASLAVIIEAVRLLEDAGVATCERGRRGGVTLVLPRRSAIIQFVHGYLASAKATGQECSALCHQINMFAAARAAKRRTQADLSMLKADYNAFMEASESDFMPHWYRLQSHIYDIGANKALHTLSVCLAGYTVRSFGGFNVGISAAFCEQMARCTHELVAGILAGDSARARNGQQAARAILDTRAPADAVRRDT